jgi:hypothetical protein
MSEDCEVTQVRKARFQIGPHASIALGEGVDAELPPEDHAKVRRVAETLKAYRAALKEMLAGKYAALQSVAPIHMTDACCSRACLLQDWIIIRYDQKQTPDQKGFVGLIREGTLATSAPALSGSCVHCPAEIKGYDPGDQVLTLSLSARPADTMALMTQRLYVLAGRSIAHSQAARRPVPLASIRNEFDIQLFCEMAPERSEPARPFILRSTIKLPLHWEAFEIFHPYEHEVWDPRAAPDWAESDLLASVVSQNLADVQFREIDPHSQARKAAAAMLGSFEKLLADPEEPLHQYLKEKPVFSERRCWMPWRPGCP